MWWRKVMKSGIILVIANPTVLVTEIPPTETTTTPAPAATTKSHGFDVALVVL